jgi:tripartite-type tricarboxylate transporter receptor subunit TctC
LSWPQNNVVTTRRNLLAAALVTPAVRARAQADWPSRPIRVISPYAPGGVVDILARLVGDKLQRSLGQPFIVEARAGAGGNIGTAFVARAKGDAYTLLMGASGPLAINIALGQNTGYDPLTDFLPICLVAATPMLLVVPANSRAFRLADLVGQIRATQGTFIYGSGGPGTPQHLAGEMFRQAVGFTATHVPYSGSAPAVTALLAGEIPFIFDNLALVLPHLRAGALRALAVAGPQRVPQLTDVPTMIEEGFPGFQARGWYGLLAPSGVPSAVVARLSEETQRALRLPDVAQRLESGFGSPYVGTSPEGFAQFIAADIARWQGVVRAGNLRLE